MNLRTNAAGNAVFWDAGYATTINADGSTRASAINSGGYGGAAPVYLCYVPGYTSLSLYAADSTIADDTFIKVARWNGGTDLSVYAGVSTIIAGDRIVTGSVTATQIASKTITADNIAARTIKADNIATSAIEADKIAAGAITADKIAANQIAANKLIVASRPFSAVGFNFRVDLDGILRWDYGVLNYPDGYLQLQGSAIRGGYATWPGGTVYIVYNATAAGDSFTVTQDRGFLIANDWVHIATWTGGYDVSVKVGAATILNGDRILTGSINANRITARTITANEIAVGTITADNIAAGTISADKIATNAIIAKALAIGNTDSIIPDSDFRDLSFWVGDNATPAMSVNDQNGGWQWRRYLGFTGASGSFSRFGRFFPVEPGASYKVKIGMFIAALPNTGAIQQSMFFNACIH